MPLISVIVPAHNEEKLLGETLRAIYNSATVSCITLEVIVVSDASSDRTSQIARQWECSVIETNFRSRARSRNYGATTASGEILVFVDADTIVEENFFKEAVYQMNQGVEVTWPVLVPLGQYIPAIIYYNVLNTVSKWNPVFSPVIVVSSSYFANIAKFDESLGSFEDLFFLKKAWENGVACRCRATAHTSIRRIKEFGYLRSFYYFTLACLDPYSHQWKAMSDI